MISKIGTKFYLELDNSSENATVHDKWYIDIKLFQQNSTKSYYYQH